MSASAPRSTLQNHNILHQSPRRGRDDSRATTGSYNRRRTVVPKILDKHYPIALRYTIAQMLPWLLGAAVLVAIVLLTNFSNPQATVAIHPEKNFGGVLFLGSLLIILGAKLAHLLLYRSLHRYWIEEGNFVVEKGVIFKSLGSYPLQRISDVYVDCTLPLALLGLYRLEVRTASHESEQFARIEGLSRKNALGIKSAIVHSIGRLEGARRQESFNSKGQMLRDDRSGEGVTYQ